MKRRIERGQSNTGITLGFFLITFIWSCNATNFDGGGNGVKTEQSKGPIISPTTHEISSGADVTVNTDSPKTPSPSIQPVPADDNKLTVELKQDIDACRWSIWFRREITQPNGQLASPQSCNNGEYMAGVGYQGYTGGSDGVAKIFCCKIPSLSFSAFMHDDCTWTDYFSHPTAQTCRPGQYLTDIDYYAETNRIANSNGRMRFSCCAASKSKTLAQNNCSWSAWFATETGTMTHQCAIGQYVGGLDYNTAATGISGGQIRVFCCSPMDR